MKTVAFCISFSLAIHCLACVCTAETLRTVALSGDVAPGTGGSRFFTGFTSPSLNNSGRTAFLGEMTGATIDRGIWSEQSGSGLSLVAKVGDAAPGTESGVTFSGFPATPPVLNESDQTAFQGFLTGTGVTGSNGSGAWSEGGSGLTLVAREGSPAPGTGSGVTFRFPLFPLFNDSGFSAFVETLIGTGVDLSNNRGIWSEGGGSGLALVARTGNPAPDTGSGVNFSALGGTNLNGNGHTAFAGQLVGTSVDTSNDRGIWKETGIGLSLVAREGTPAPGTDTGVNFGDFFNVPALNDNDHTAFEGRLTGTGVDGTNDRGIWSEGGGSGLSLVAREGNAAPDTESGVNFLFFGDIVLSGSGYTAFKANLTGTGIDSTNAIGIWSEGGGNGLELLAREGFHAPGAETGVNFQSFNDPSLNGNGQTAFKANLTGIGVDSTNDKGLWATDVAGNLRLIAREGGSLDVDDGPGTDFRTVSAIGFIGESGGEDGRASGFNDLGQVAFGAAFTDGTFGVFVSNLVKVPEPGTFLLGLLVGISVILSSQRSRYHS